MSVQIWVTVAVTDRAKALRLMLGDIVHQCRGAGVTLKVFILENSGNATERSYTRATTYWLRSERVAVALESEPPFRRPIAESRCRQRDWVAAEVNRSSAPDIIWMLDDDNRLDHLVWNGALEVCKLENHVGRLVELDRTPGRPDLLIGGVTGDPPIPPAATLASRLADTQANLQLLFVAHPDDPASSALSELRIVGEHDDYYDFSVERSQPTWTAPCRWLPSSANATVQEATSGLLMEARHLANGIALTRPLLTAPARLTLSEPGYRRGGNAVFFSTEACLQHTYPSVLLAGRWTRRGDMVGSRLLSRSFRVEVGGFSVRHCRRRDSKAPTANGLIDSIVADNLGATLARAVEAPHNVDVMKSFLEARVARIHGALSAARSMSGAVRDQLNQAPPWVPHALTKQLCEVLEGVGAALPLDDGWSVIVDQLSSTRNLRTLQDVAVHECSALEATR